MFTIHVSSRLSFLQKGNIACTGRCFSGESQFMLVTAASQKETLRDGKPTAGVFDQRPAMTSQ